MGGNYYVRVIDFCFILFFFYRMLTSTTVIVYSLTFQHRCVDRQPMAPLFQIRQLLVLLMQIKLRGDVWASKTNLTPPHFTEVPVLRQNNGRPCVFLLDI